LLLPKQKQFINKMIINIFVITITKKSYYQKLKV